MKSGITTNPVSVKREWKAEKLPPCSVEKGSEQAAKRWERFGYVVAGIAGGAWSVVTIHTISYWLWTAGLLMFVLGMMSQKAQCSASAIRENERRKES